MTLTIGEILAERIGSGRLLRLYRTDRLRDPWVGEDEDGSLWQWPAESDGWLGRKPFTGARDRLTEVEPHNALGTGWPGLTPPQ